MERKVGDKFYVNGCVYLVVGGEGTGFHCNECAMKTACSVGGRVSDVVGECVGWRRRDGKSVHFVYFGVDF